MAESIDERVVQLTLDNKQFNRASSETIDSIEKLKKTLEFEGAIDSFEEIEKEINKVDFSSINNGVDGVGRSFTILDTITDAVFRNMTNRVIDFGERTLKSLSTDQIVTGWNKYAEQTGAVQTIMAATAQQFDDTAVQMESVNDQLEKLTWFTDETSHKFNDMVGGIGKFTANNVDLETSVKAMEGIATWASLSGANANEASRAIYNLAQAVSVGSVKLIDWRSIENANMGTTEFKQTVIETAEEVGTLIKVADGLYKTLSGKDVSISNFSENLSDGWFNSEVLLKSLDRYGNFADRLNQFANKTGKLTATLLEVIDDYVDGTLNMNEAMKLTGMSAEELTPWLEELGSAENDLGRRAFKAAQETKTFQEAIDYVKEAVSSGWATSFKYIFGDYLEAKAWWSEIAEVMYDAFVVGGEIRNTILSMWKDRGGRDDFLNGIRAGIENITDIIETFKDAWNEVWFGDADEQLENQANLLLDITRGFRELMESLAPTSATIQNLKTILSSVFSILRSGVNVIKSIARGLSPILSLLNMISGTILQIIANLTSSFSNKLSEFLNEERLNRISQVLNAIGTIISALANVGLALLLTGIEKVYNVVKDIFRQIGESGGGIKGVITVLTDTVKDFFETFATGETIVNKAVNGILFIFGGLAEGIKIILDTIAKLITGELTFNDLFSGNGLVSDGINGFSDVLTKLNLGPKIDAIVGWIKNFVGELVAADGIIYNFINNLVTGLTYLKDFFVGILDVMTIGDIKDFLLIAVLWNFTSSLSKLNTSLSGSVGQFTRTMRAFNNFLESGFSSSATLDKLTNMFNRTTFLQIGIAITLLVAALGKLNQLDWDQTQKSVAYLGTTLALLLAAFRTFAKIKATMPKEEKADMTPVIDSLGRNLIALGAAALMVSQAVKVLNEALYDEDGKLNITKLIGTTVSIGAIITGLIVAVKQLDHLDVRKAGKSLPIMIGIAASVRLLMSSMAVMSKFDIPTILSSSLSLAGIIAALGFAVSLMSEIDWKSALTLIPLVVAVSTGILEIVAAVGILSLVAQQGNIETALTTLGISIIALSVGIGALYLAFNEMDVAKIFAISTAMLAFGAAMIEFAGAIGIISMIQTVNWQALGQLAILIVAVSVAIGGLGVVLQSVKPDRIIAIGTAFLAFGASVTVMAAGLKLLAGVEWNKISAGVAVIGTFMGVFSALIVVLVTLATPVLFESVAKGIDMIGSAFLKFSAAVTVLATGLFLLSAAAGVAALIAAGFQQLADKLGVDLPAMISAGFDTLELIIREFLEMLRNLAPDFFVTFVSLFGMIALAIAAVKHPTGLAVAGIILEILSVLESHGQDVIDTLANVINMIASAEKLFDALTNLAYTIGLFLAEALLAAACGALAGIVGGIAGCVSMWLGQGFKTGMIEIEDDMAGQYNESLSKAIDDLNNEQLSSKAKGQAFNIAQGIVQGWIDGEENITQEAALSALKAMDAYSDAATGETKKTTDAIMAQLLQGIVDNEKQIKDAGELMAEYEIQGYKDGTDPDEPGDWFRYYAQTIAKQIGLGTDDISGNVYGSGWDMAADYISGWSDNILQNLDIDLPFTNLVSGRGKSKYALSDRDIEKRNKAKRRVNELYGIEMIDEVNAGAEKEIDNTASDLGNKWLENLASGIDSSLSRASGAAKTAAQTISSSFSDELDKISRETQISDKLFKLWTAQNPTASEIEYQSEKVALATQKASITQQIYQQTLEAMGAEAQETHEAYMTMLDDQISMLEAQNKLAEISKSNASDQREAWQKYTDLIYQTDSNGNYITDFLKNQGFTMEEISKAYAQQAGYVLPQLAKDTSDVMLGIVGNNGTAAIETLTTSTLEATKAAEPVLKEAGASGVKSYADGVVEASPAIAESLNNSITTSAEAAKPTANTKGQEIGLSEDQGYGKGVDDNTDIPVKATENTCDATIRAAESYLKISGGYSGTFWDIGKYVAQGMAKGISENQSVITDAAVAAAKAAYAAAMKALNAHSPSRLMMDVGMYYDQGLALGIRNYAKTVENSATNMVDNLVDSTTNSLNNQNGIDNYLQKMFGLEDNQLHIGVVLDMDASAYDDKISELERAYLVAQGGQTTYQAGSTMSTIATDDRYISSSLQQLANTEAYRSRQLQSLYDLVDSYFTESKLATVVSPSSGGEGAGAVVNNFTQNNYSPKAISRVDTYRQTKRQFDEFTRKIEIKR